MATILEQVRVRAGQVPVPVAAREERHTSRLIVALSSLIVALALVAAGVGLFWRDAGETYTVTTLRGEEVEIYGRDLYRYDTLFTGAANKGTDAVSLFLGVPLLVAGIALYRRGSLRGHLLLAGALTWFLYVYASYALGAVAYNSLFLIYVALFFVSIAALTLTLRAVDLDGLSERLAGWEHQRALAVFMFASAAVTFAVWMMSPAALIDGGPPDGLGTHTTLFTTAFDIAIIVPAVSITGLLIWQRNPLGYATATVLLLLEAMLAPMIVAQTVSQVSAGVTFTTAEIVGPIAGFTTIALIAVGILYVLMRTLATARHRLPPSPAR